MNNTNLIEQNSTIKTRAIFSKDHKKRYLLHILWDDSKPKACIIMISPSTADEFQLDQTTMLVRNNAVTQGYGSISIVNLFCSLDSNKCESDRVNSSVITEEVSNADIVIVAYGRGTSHSEEKERLLEALKSYGDKLYCIQDSTGQPFSHPLSPRARKWMVVKL